MAKTRGGRRRVPTRRSKRLMTPTNGDSSLKETVKDTVVAGESSECEVVRQRKRKRKPRVAEDVEEDRESVSGDDCEVVGDEDCDEVGYAEKQIEIHEEDPASTVGVQEEDCDGGIDLEEQNCENFEGEFGVDAREEDNRSETDADSGDEIWDDERIPEPRSRSDDEHEDEDDVPEETGDPEDFIRLGKTFNSPEDFKIAVLKYSLKTRYDIKLYRSRSLRVGAKCSDTDVNCSWRCYCSYDRKKKKM